MASQFKEDMRRITDGGPRRVVLDLGQVDFIDSSGLGAIVAAMKQMDADGTLALAAPTETVRKVFRLTRMDTVFEIFDSLDEALGPRAT